MIKVLLADDHNLFREGVLKMLEQENFLDIVDTAENGKELEKKYNELLPDMVISDISMPIKNGPEAVKTLKNKYPEIKVLFLSQFIGDDYIYSIIKAGGLGLASKNSSKEELIFAINEVYAGRQFFLGKDEEELSLIIRRFDNIQFSDDVEDVSILSEKEKEILDLIGEGLSSEKIAEKLEISRRTVDSHRHNILGLLNLNSASELVRYAVLRYVKKNKDNY